MEGDITLSKFSKARPEDLASVMPPPLIGVDQSGQMLEWIWDNFSTVAGEQPSFER